MPPSDPTLNTACCERRLFYVHNGVSSEIEGLLGVIDQGVMSVVPVRLKQSVICKSFILHQNTKISLQHLSLDSRSLLIESLT